MTQNKTAILTTSKTYLLHPILLCCVVMQEKHCVDCVASESILDQTINVQVLKHLSNIYVYTEL